MIYVFLNHTDRRVVFTSVDDPTKGILLGKFKQMPQGNPAFIAHALLRKNSIALDHGISVVVE
jgi:hypothetical protein